MIAKKASATPTSTAAGATPTATPELGEPPASGPLFATTTTVGTTGGEIVSPLGYAVSFPPGSVDVATDVTLRVYAAADVPAPPAGYVALSEAIDLLPEGVTFDPPAVITFPYDGTQPEVAAGSVSIWVFLNGAWQQLGGEVDPVAGTVSISVPHFTLYQLMGSVAADDGAQGLPDTGDGAAGGVDGRGALSMIAALIAIAGAFMLRAGMVRPRG